MISVKVQDAIVENVVEEFDDREKKSFVAECIYC